MLNVYAQFCEESLAMPVVKGKKTESDKFAGAVSTYAIEALMHDGKALNIPTSQIRELTPTRQAGALQHVLSVRLS